MAYNWQLPDWTNFTFDINQLQGKLLQYSQGLGQIQGEIAHLSADERLNINLQIMVDEAMKTSEIEGELISRDDVVSSIKLHLGLQPDRNLPKDARALGVAALMKRSRDTFAEPLSESTLFAWHDALLGYARDSSPLVIGTWRTHAEPMQIISGRHGKVKVHFEAPPSNQVPIEMKRYIKWFNETARNQQNEIVAAPIRAALAHLYYESIHPFEDGNGRIGRALSEKALSQAFEQPIPFSLSSCIEPKRKCYYAALKKAQVTNDVTDWLIYFVDMLIEAQELSRDIIVFTLKKASFFEKHMGKLNPRQFKVVTRMLDCGPAGFEGGMTAKKVMAITQCSKATATRDISDLVSKAILYEQGGAGRTTHYGLII